MLMIYIFFELTIQWLLSHVFNNVEYQSELLLYKYNQQGFTHRLSAEIFFHLRVTQNIFFVSKSHLLEYVCLLTLV